MKPKKVNFEGGLGPGSYQIDEGIQATRCRSAVFKFPKSSSEVALLPRPYTVQNMASNDPFNSVVHIGSN